MKSVIFIEPQVISEKPVEFTHRHHYIDGWIEDKSSPVYYSKIVYLGKCNTDGDMFAAYDSGSIYIFKGHLNSGKY